MLLNGKAQRLFEEVAALEKSAAFDVVTKDVAQVIEGFIFCAINGGVCHNFSSLHPGHPDFRNCVLRVFGESGSTTWAFYRFLKVHQASVLFYIDEQVGTWANHFTFEVIRLSFGLRAYDK